jgi:HTH-type transcriptional regulator/antitoxin HigA
MKFKVIKTEQQYHSYLDEVHRLLSEMPTPRTEDSEKLELLTTLLEAYENQKFPIEAIDPIDAIIFRMKEKGLKQADLVPYFGTRSRVSEVLSGKRPLTVPMIRAISIGLGISADTLLGMPDNKSSSKSESIDWGQFPIKEMVSRGWIQRITGKAPISVEKEVKDFLSQVGLQFGENAAFKRSLSGDAYSPATKYSLHAWLARVIQQARVTRPALGLFDETVFSTAFLREIAQLSWSEQGPKIAVEFLEKHGIAVVIEPHLKGTMLDGAAIKDIDGAPIIGLTLRYDRLDNFWLTLLHEIAHIWRHVKKDNAVVDDLDASSTERNEVEANRLAREAFIPRVIWKRSDAYLSPSKENIDLLSRELKITPAVIAGRLRKERGNYQLFSDLIGQGEVRRQLMA